VAISTSLGCNIADYTFSDINTKDTVDTVYPEYDIEQDVPLEPPDTRHQTPDTPVSCQVRIREEGWEEKQMLESGEIF